MHDAAFDPASGQLTVESGVTIADILATFVPRGFFLKVVPGTKFVSIGGAIASDVHGKNHHRDGSFGDHVTALRLALPNGEIISCSREENTELFTATIGCMGLTGVIVEATLQMIPIETGWLKQTTGHYDAPMQAIWFFLVLGVAAYAFLVRKKYAPV